MGTVTPDLTDWLAATDAADLLPARRRDEAGRIRWPLTLVAAGWFDDVHGYAIVQDAREVTYGVPLVVDPRVVRPVDPLVVDPPVDRPVDRLVVDPPVDRPVVRRAVAGDGTAAALVAALPRLSRFLGPGARTPGQIGQFVSHLPGSGTNGRGGEGEVAIEADQTNDLVVVGGGGDRVVVKWDLHPAAGAQVGPERLAALARAGFAGTPRTDALVGLNVDDVSHHIATVTEYVADAVDGWQWAVDEVRALARGAVSAADAAVADVARLVAGLHLALAADADRTALAADADCSARATAADVASWVDDANRTIAAAALGDDTRAAVTAAVAPLADAVGTAIAPIHGDLHVGQVLRAGDPPRYLVIDFDGNPTDDPQRRRAPQPVARDVASMLASWDHVGRVVLHRTDDLDARQRARVLEWIERAQHGFLATYSAELAGAGRANLLDRRLLRPYQVLQECREYAYARRYLPHWRFVPDAALPALLARPPEDTP